MASTDERLSQRSIDTIRTLSIDAVEKAKSGHPGTPMALAPLAYALWTRVLAYDSSDPDAPERDRFVLSAGHASMLLYSVLHLTGYGVSLEDLRQFRQWGSRTPGHPEHGHTPGVETTTGPLGQGLANAVGLALGERMLAARFNRPGHEVVDHRTWVIASDGDLMEGVASEAASLAGHWGLSKLCVFWDDNRITIDGPTTRAFTEDVVARFAAYGWNVLRVPDTATVDDLVAAADAARRETDRPTFVAVRTHIGIGSGRVDSAKAHGEPLGPDEVRTAKRSYGWPEDAQFLVPEDVAQHMKDAAARAAARLAERARRLSAYRVAFPAEARALEDALAGRLPDGAESGLDAIGLDGKATSTRKASGAAIAALAAKVRELVGGSADLAGSNVTNIPGGGDVGPGAFGGRNLAFGVREHGMGGILNGLALHGGWRPFGGTFLIFSDYLKPSLRLASLMRVPVTYVFTHDSIGLGEDGPTHQPIEHLAALRAVPGLTVIRPADAAETAEAWRIAIRSEGPVALALTRQDLPAIGRPRAEVTRGVARGAYVARAESGSGAPDVVLIGTGSEVAPCLGAADLLAAEGVRARVVSMPCPTLFGAADAREREAVLPADVPRVVVEAAATLGWDRWAGPDGAILGLDHFGASAPAPRLFQEFGFTPARIAALARSVLASRAVRGTGGPVRT